MPVYQYYEIFPDGSEGEPFEVSQKMSDSTLKIHPLTGNPVKKYFSAPAINTQYSDTATKQQLDPSNLEKQGFTQYEKDKTSGKYYKSAGSDSRAPEQIDPKNL